MPKSEYFPGESSDDAQPHRGSVSGGSPLTPDIINDDTTPSQRFKLSATIDVPHNDPLTPEELADLVNNIKWTIENETGYYRMLVVHDLKLEMQ